MIYWKLNGFTRAQVGRIVQLAVVSACAWRFLGHFNLGSLWTMRWTDEKWMPVSLLIWCIVRCVFGASSWLTANYCTASLRSSLVAHARAYRVPARCARIPLSTWLGAFIPRRRASSRRRHRLTTAATVSLDVYAHRSTNMSYHRRRSRLSCRRRSCLERTVTYVGPVTAFIQETPQDWTVCTELSR